MNWKRLRLVLLAIVLVYIGSNIIISIPFQRIYLAIVNPQADTGDIIELLQDDDVDGRLQGLAAYHTGLRDAPDLQRELAVLIAHDPDIKVRQRAINLLAGIAATHPSLAAEKAPVDSAVIDQIVALLGEVDTTTKSVKTDEMKYLEGLINFAGYTAKWQSRPETGIAHLTDLLDQSSPVQGEEHYAGIYRNERRAQILLALQGYAYNMMLPHTTLDSVLALYSEENNIRIKEKAARIFQYHAINGPLPATIRQAVVDTMFNDPGRQLQLVAIMTMEWIGKQEGGVPAELTRMLEIETDPETQNHISHVILRIQKNSNDSVAALLAIANDQSKPVSLRNSALHTAVLQHGKDPRVTENLLALTRDNEPSLRAAAVRQLPNSQIYNRPGEQPVNLLLYIDNALADPDPMVRSAAIHKVRVFELSDDDRVKRLESALLDEDDEVFVKALEVIRQSGLHSAVISERVAKRSSNLDHAGQHSAELTQQKIHKQTRGLWQTIVETAKDTRQHGVRLFWVLAALGILVAAGFAINYVYQLLVIISDHRQHKFMVLGVLVVWAILTYVMVGVFVIGAFGFGHNSLVPPKDQFIIDAVMGSALLIYTLTGWGMHRLVIRKSNNRKTH